MNILKHYKGRVPACGIYCGGCPIYTRQKNPCPGATINNARCEKCKTFHLCCVERGITHCFECSKYPCTKLKNFAKRWEKYGQNQLENLEMIKEGGCDKFLEHFNSLVENKENQTK